MICEVVEAKLAKHFLIFFFRLGSTVFKAYVKIFQTLSWYTFFVWTVLSLSVPFFDSRALRLLIEDQQLWNNYIKDYGTFVLCQFTNTCVPDSLLAALHTAYIKYADIEDLLDRNAFFGKIMSLLNKKKYQEARQHFLQELNPGKVDLHSHVKDYFPLIAKLTWIKFTYEQKNPIMCAIYKEIPR